MGPAPQIDFNIKTPVNDITGYSTKVWYTIKKYSINNTLPIAAVNTWLQFSLAYVTAMVITLNDLSFIATFNPTLMPTYFLVSVILGVVLLTSLALRYIYKQEIENEKSKDGDSPIDIKIRGGKSDEINEIAQNALTIEIIPDLVDKKQGFSIVLPISEKQGEILENKRQENRNKVILLAVPYVLSGLIVAGSLIQNKFSFANVQGWAEWGFIAFVSAVFIAGICIALSKLKSNEVNNTYNVVKKFNNLDILLPCRKGSVVSVMENKFESKEENDPISRLERLFDKHLTDLINKICYLFKNDLLGPANANIEKTLDGMKKDVATLLNKLEEIIKQNLDGVEATANEAITQCLVNIDKSVDELCKGVSKDVKGKLSEVDVKKVMDTINAIKNAVETIDDRVARLKPGQYTGLAGATFANERLPNVPRESRSDQSPQGERASSNEEHDEEHAQRVDWEGGVKEIGQLKKKIEALKRALEEKENNSGTSPQTSSTTSNGPQRDEEEILDEELARLGKEERIEEKREKIKNLKEARPKQKEIKEWKEKINGKPSDFLYYLLKFIKLEEKDNKEKKVEATLRDFDNKIIIHWKDGSQTICHIKKQGDLPSTKVDFVDQNIQAAFKVACAG
ncbi:hypothetical protein [Wolbachia endosymbiont (group A) of Longitarsus flavicornis]|uniref:hypothetical protein n=1 Tax=Wolbachia endosymbiont (group A) of Longitarsus flavicornis TaxID=3066134 RepID=UPI0030CA4514